MITEVVVESTLVITNEDKDEEVITSTVYSLSELDEVVGEAIGVWYVSVEETDVSVEPVPMIDVEGLEDVIAVAELSLAEYVGAIEVEVALSPRGMGLGASLVA